MSSLRPHPISETLNNPQPREFSEPPNRSGHERGHLVPVRNVNAEAIDPLAVPEFRHDLIDVFFPYVCGADRCTFCK